MKAKRPIVFGGGGIVISGATEELQNFANRLKIPVTLTLMGLVVTHQRSNASKLDWNAWILFCKQGS